MTGTRTLYLLAACLLVAGCMLPAGERPAQQPSGERDAQVELGQQIYREGIGADGEPVEALVMGDIPVFGDQFTCLHCHRYSGVGGAEGTKYVMPTSGPALFNPRVGLYHERPAYNDETLTDVLRTGMDPGGNLLDSAMPAYDLNETDMQALIAYLKTLSSTFSPGVDEDYLHVATVIGPDVPETATQGMLAVMNRFFADTNGQARRQAILYDKGPFYHEYKNKAYREWKLHVWQLEGAPSSWPGQLAEHYEQQPVFAMVSGITSAPWQPIHDFARSRKIPCILPNTDLPAPAADDDFYTLYFSRGLGLEGLVILDDLSRNAENSKLLQVYLDGPRQNYAAAMLQLARADFPRVEIVQKKVSNIEQLAETLQQERYDAAAVWTDREQTQQLAGRLAGGFASPLYFSSTLIERDLATLPPALPALVAQPYNLPEDQETRALRTTAWIKGKKIDLVVPRIQTQTWYACKVFHSGIKHIKRNFYRDYLLDALDHSSRLGPYASNYPRLSFGPDQRYLAKGAYLIRVGKTVTPGQTDAEWRTP